jgi:hypothetical protein
MTDLGPADRARHLGTCGDCWFWEPHRHSIHAAEPTGFCRRYPPRPSSYAEELTAKALCLIATVFAANHGAVADTDITQLPATFAEAIALQSTDDDDWCGEWRAKP